MCVYMCTRICAIHFSHGFMLKYFRVCLWALLCIYMRVCVCVRDDPHLLPHPLYVFIINKMPHFIIKLKTQNKNKMPS